MGVGERGVVETNQIKVKIQNLYILLLTFNLNFRLLPFKF